MTDHWKPPDDVFCKSSAELPYCDYMRDSGHRLIGEKISQIEDWDTHEKRRHLFWLMLRDREVAKND